MNRGPASEGAVGHRSLALARLQIVLHVERAEVGAERPVDLPVERGQPLQRDQRAQPAAGQAGLVKPVPRLDQRIGVDVPPRSRTRSSQRSSESGGTPEARACSAAGGWCAASLLDLAGDQQPIGARRLVVSVHAAPHRLQAEKQLPAHLRSSRCGRALRGSRAGPACRLPPSGETGPSRSRRRAASAASRVRSARPPRRRGRNRRPAGSRPRPVMRSVRDGSEVSHQRATHGAQLRGRPRHAAWRNRPRRDSWPGRSRRALWLRTAPRTGRPACRFGIDVDPVPNAAQVGVERLGRGQRSAGRSGEGGRRGAGRQ